MAKCDLCGKKLGFFAKNTCDADDCDAIICDDCLEKQNNLESPNTWGTCLICNSTFCGKHYDKHPCDESEEESSGDLIILESKDKNLVYINSGDVGSDEMQSVVDKIAEYLSNGYIISATQGDSQMWLVKKNE